MDDQVLRCNNRTLSGGICRKELKEIAIVTTCSHVLCKECAESTGFMGTNTNKRKCPVCKQLLPNVDDAAETNLQPTEEYKMSVLCGFDPNTIMECASSALSFWNYQVFQETAYQQHLLLALSKKYSHLNDGVDKLVNDANTQIESLHKRVDAISQDNQKLQKKNEELADTCRERGKKYSDLRKGYEVLKKIVQSNQQGPITEKGAEQALRSFVANPATEAIKNAIIGTPVIENRHDIQPDQLGGLDTRYTQMGHNQIHGGHHGGSGSQNSGDISRMPPPRKPPNSSRISPVNIASQHRTPLPGAFRVAADRGSSSGNANRVSYPHTFLPPGSSHRQTVRSSGSHSAGGDRPNTRGGFGGIFSGMKVGGSSTDSQLRALTGYIPARNINHHHNDSV